jgi:hypothetical protein
MAESAPAEPPIPTTGKRAGPRRVAEPEGGGPGSEAVLRGVGALRGFAVLGDRGFPAGLPERLAFRAPFPDPFFRAVTFQLYPEPRVLGSERWVPLAGQEGHPWGSGDHPRCGGARRPCEHRSIAASPC